MRQLVAFCKKEWMEMLRTSKFLILLIVFALFGIMSPAFAKLTPAILNMFSEDLTQQGMIIAEIKVDAFTCWQQYYKNVPITLIVFVIMFSTIISNEYQKGTLINMLTKGLSRWKVVVAKTITMVMVWTVCHWICFGITYGYAMYFWDNSKVFHVFLGSALVYFFGIWLISLIVLGSCLFSNSFSVLMVVGSAIGLSWIIGFIPKMSKYLPTYLMDAGNLMDGMVISTDFTSAILFVFLFSILNIVLGVMLFNHKRM